MRESSSRARKTFSGPSLTSFRPAGQARGLASLGWMNVQAATSGAHRSSEPVCRRATREGPAAVRGQVHPASGFLWLPAVLRGKPSAVAKVDLVARLRKWKAHQQDIGRLCEVLTRRQIILRPPRSRRWPPAQGSSAAPPSGGPRYFMLSFSSASAWSKVATRMKPSRGYSMSMMTLTATASTAAKPIMWTQLRDLPPAMP
jgi:hypothetical protein